MRSTTTIKMTKGYVWMSSNLSHGIKIQWLGAVSFLGSARGKNRAPGAMATSGEGDQTRATERETPQRFFQRDLEGKGVSFYSLSVEETIHRELAAAASPAPRSSLKLCLDPLKVLLGSIAPNGSESI
jgi:hypothetical protein